MPKELIDPKTLHNVLRRGVSEIIVEEEFVRLLQEGKPLRLKMGFDPSRPDIHLGHAVGLRKLRQLQDLGHQVVLIVGDWTAQIGDPSGQSVTRPMLTAEEVRANAETYLRQFFRVVDKERTQTVWQSEWFGSFTLANVFDLTRRFTVAQFLARDDFAQRFQAQRPIAITELLYPLLQAYDSVAIHSDVEFGGSDQRFNLLVGRDLQGMMGQRQQQCFIMPILVGTDGVQKMSKSLGNYIGVEESPRDMYGKVMSIPDSAIMDYLELLTDVPDVELAEMRHEMEAQAVNPMELKKRLARDIVAQFHHQQAARQAEEYFERTYQRGQVPEEVPRVYFKRDFDTSKGAVSGLYPGGEPIVRFQIEGDSEPFSRTAPAVGTLAPDGKTVVATDAMTTGVLHVLGLASSRSEARRLIAQGAVEIDGRRVGDSLPLRNGVLRVGKQRYVRLEEA